jgi:hypothetical protein
LKYAVPNYWIHQRHGVLSRYEICLPELGDRYVGLVEKYTSPTGSQRWRTLDYKLDDWRDNFGSREEASQDLVTTCPRVMDLISRLRERRLNSPEIKQIK